MPFEWDVKTFLNPMEALSVLTKSKPWVIIADQSLEGMEGDELLAIVKKMSSESVRIIQTDQIEEELFINYIKNAQVYDFIKKPWAKNEMQSRIKLAVDQYQADERTRNLARRYEQIEEELREANSLNSKLKTDNEAIKTKASSYLSEIEQWAPAQIAWAIKNGRMPEAGKRPVAILVLVNNAGVFPDTRIEGRTLRHQLIQAYSDSIGRHSGYRDLLGGGISAAYFGILDDVDINPADDAFTSATELKVTLENLQRIAKFYFGSTIILDFKEDVTVQVHQAIANIRGRMSTQKSLDVSGFDYSKFRTAIEAVKNKTLNETNIIVTKAFKERLGIYGIDFEPVVAEASEETFAFFKVVKTSHGKK